MTLTELKFLSDELTSDAKFLAHEKVRRVYWKALGEEGPWKHDLSFFGIEPEPCQWHCTKCGQPYHGEIETHESIFVECTRNFSRDPACPIPDKIPGSLADAAERLRERVILKRRKTKARAAAMSIEGSVTGADTWLAFAPARVRFLVFAAAAGGTEGD